MSREENVDIIIEDIITDAFFLDPQNEMSRFLKDLEKKLILAVLKKVNGNQKEAATLLRIKYTTLNEKIHRYKIVPSKKEILVDEAPALEPAYLFVSKD